MTSQCPLPRWLAPPDNFFRSMTLSFGRIYCYASAFISRILLWCLLKLLSEFAMANRCSKCSRKIASLPICSYIHTRSTSILRVSGHRVMWYSNHLFTAGKLQMFPIVSILSHSINWTGDSTGNFVDCVDFYHPKMKMMSPPVGELQFLKSPWDTDGLF